MSVAAPRGLWAALSRAAAALLGGYALTLAFTALLATALQRLAHWGRGEATLGASLLAFLVYLLVALRAFVAPTQARAWGEPLGAALLLAALAAALA